MTDVVMLQVDVSSNRSDSVPRSLSVAVHRRCKTVQMHADAVSTLHIESHHLYSCVCSVWLTVIFYHCHHYPVAA